MKNFLSSVKQKVDQAELYFYQSTYNSINYQNGILDNIDATIQCGYSLRIIKNSTLGFAYTKNLNDPESLLQGALSSLNSGTNTNLRFPSNQNKILLNTYEPAIERFESKQAVEECNRIIEILREKLNTKIDIHQVYGTEDITILNTNGAELSNKFSYYLFILNAIFPHTASGLMYTLKDKKFSPVPDVDLSDFINMYQQAEPECKLKSGRMKVLFLPSTLYALLWRMASGTAGSNVYYKKSPLINKIGEKIFSERLTIYEDPQNDNYPLARAFDDEGTETQNLTLVENGILKNFYYDLFYADKMGTSSTGNGYKSMMWGGETASLKPAPTLSHTVIKPGDDNLKELINTIDKGIIVAGVLGAHSGNIPNGDFSIGVEPCLYVEKGQILGRAKNTMIAGNIYDVMKNVVAIEDRLHQGLIAGKALPSILFDGIMVVSA